jgi:predicted enzyme related to lactoylglutathione lyase
MDITDMAIGLPVSDLDLATAWYRQVLELGEPDLEPVPGTVEFRVGPVWLQLVEGESIRSGAEVAVSFGVADAAAEHRRLTGADVPVGPLEHVPGAVDHFEFTDPDGNRLGVHSDAATR